MEYMKLGKTNLEVTRVSFGGIPIQTVSEEEAIKVVRHCYDRGINFFDNGRAYSDSEEKMGKALEGRRDKVLIATKLQARDRDKFAEDLQKSLKNLRTDYLDLCQLHNLMKDEDLDKVMAPGGVMDYLEELRQKGVVRHIGVTSHNIERAIKAMKTGRFETVMVAFNYMEQGPLKELIPLARSMKMGVIAMKTLSGGVTENPGPALRWAYQFPDILLIPGVCKVEEVDDNLAAVKTPFSAADEALLKRESETLGKSFCRRCEYCMPCPNGINIRFIQGARLFFQRFGWKHFNEKHAEMLTKGLACEACGVCEPKCPYQLKISELMPVKSREMIELARSRGLM